MKYLTFLLIGILFGCGTPSSQKKNDAPAKEKTEEISANGFVLAITEVDNSVRVFIDDSLVFSSGTIHSSPEVDFKIELNPFIKDGTEELKVEVYNGVEPYEPQHDPLWEIRYDLIYNGEIVDFIHEFGDDNKIGLVYENVYILEEWKDMNQ